jgi:hypothetical protein
MDAKPASAGIRLLEVQNRFEKGQAQLILGMLRRTRALILQACESITFKGVQNRIDVGPRQLETVGNTLSLNL